MSKLLLFFVAYLLELTADLNKEKMFHFNSNVDPWGASTCVVPWIQEFVLLNFLAYNKSIGFYTPSMIPKEWLMWKFPKNSQMYLINNSGVYVGFFLIQDLEALTEKN